MVITSSARSKAAGAMLETAALPEETAVAMCADPLTDEGLEAVAAEVDRLLPPP